MVCTWRCRVFRPPPPVEPGSGTFLPARQTNFLPPCKDTSMEERCCHMTADFATAASQNASSVPDPWHFGRILGPASALFVIDLQYANKKYFFCLLGYFLRYIYIILHRKKKSKNVTIQYKSRFFYHFCLMMGRSGSESGSTPLTY
jgi:hypothetical protein